VLNSVGYGVSYTTNVADMFYTNLTPDLRNQIKAGGYLPPESCTSDDAQVKELRTLHDLSLKAKLEVAMIIGVSRRANRVSVNTVHPCGMTQSPAECYSWHPSASPVMSVTPDMAKVLPPPPGFAPSQLYHDQPVFHIKTHRDAKFMRLYEVYA
jgi:hypothetical protein